MRGPSSKLSQKLPKNHPKLHVNRPEIGLSHSQCWTSDVSCQCQMKWASLVKLCTCCKLQHWSSHFIRFLPSHMHGHVVWHGQAMLRSAWALFSRQQLDAEGSDTMWGGYWTITHRQLAFGAWAMAWTSEILVKCSQTWRRFHLGLGKVVDAPRGCRRIKIWAAEGQILGNGVHFWSKPWIYLKISGWFTNLDKVSSWACD